MGVQKRVDKVYGMGYIYTIWVMAPSFLGLILLGYLLYLVNIARG
jgi:hypothetical protein